VRALLTERAAIQERVERLTAERDYLRECVAKQAVRISDLIGESQRLREALQSIANNSCCGPCLEARNVARAALAASPKEPERAKAEKA
jgi:bacterioferritin-associated ferredoxin